QFLVSFGLSAALRADLSSLCPSDCRPRFARTSVPCVLRTVGRASRGPQFLVSFGLSAALRADLSGYTGRRTGGHTCTRHTVPSCRLRLDTIGLGRTETTRPSSSSERTRGLE